MTEAGENSDDPMEHAAIGETRTVRKSKTLHSVNFTPDEYFGNDRITDHIDIADVELVEIDDMSCGPDIRITWEGEVTKRLPLYWDRHNEPVTEQEHRDARRSKWLRFGGRVFTWALSAGIIVVISTVVMNRMAGKVTINGEPMAVPQLPEVAATFGLLFVISAIILYGVKGGFPGRVGGGRR